MLMLSWEIVSRLRRIQRGKCYPQGEDLRALYLLRFRRATTRTEVRNRQEYEFSSSAALTDAHVKNYKFCAEDDIATTQSSIVQHRLWKIAGCIQRQKELRWKRNRSLLMIQPMMIAMESIWSQFSTVRCMQDVSTVLPVSTVVLITRRRARGVDEVFIPVWFQARPIKTCKLAEIGTREGGCAFPVRSTPDHKSDKRVREMINSFTTHLKEETSEDMEHKVWCVTELTMNTQPREEKTATVEKLHTTVDELEASMENLAMKVANLFAQVSNQVTNDPFMKVKKLIQDLIWKQQWKFLRKTDCDTELSTTNCPETSLREEVYNANFIRNEEKATNEEDIKDVQEAQSNLTQAIQILTNFSYEGDSERLREAQVGDHSERVRSCTHFWRVHWESGEQWYRQARMSRWRSERILFTKWLGKHNSCLSILWAMKQCQTRLRCVISVLKQMRTRLP